MKRWKSILGVLLVFLLGALVMFGQRELAIGLGVVAIAAVQLGSVVARYVHEGLVIRYAREEFPLDAVEFLRANGVRGNMAVQFEWGGYTLHHLGDAARPRSVRAGRPRTIAVPPAGVPGRRGDRDTDDCGGGQ